MSSSIDFASLCAESRALAGLTDADVALLHDLGPRFVPHLDAVTDRFYAALGAVPRTAAFIEGRVDALKKTHRAWLESLFTRAVDTEYTQWMHHVGSVHVRVNLPVEFMTSGMTLVQRELLLLAASTEGLDVATRDRVPAAIASICGFCQLVMQKSYASDRLAEELEKFLKITGMSHKLFENLAAAYK